MPGIPGSAWVRVWRAMLPSVAPTANARGWICATTRSPAWHQLLVLGTAALWLSHLRNFSYLLAGTWTTPIMPPTGTNYVGGFAGWKFSLPRSTTETWRPFLWSNSKPFPGSPQNFHQKSQQTTCGHHPPWSFIRSHAFRRQLSAGTPYHSSSQAFSHSLYGAFPVMIGRLHLSALGSA